MREQLGDQPPERHSRWAEVKRKLEDAKDSRFKNVDSSLREDYYRYVRLFINLILIIFIHNNRNSVIVI